MTFPTVKSNPWKKRHARRTRFRLWTDAEWKRIIDAGDNWISVVRELNWLLYGK